MKFVESPFSSWAWAVTEHPWRAVFAALAIAALSIAFVPNLRFETNLETFLAPDDPARLAFERSRELFGRGEPLILAVRVPGRIADPAFLGRLRALHDELEASVPRLHRITSLINVRAIEGHDDELDVGGLLDEHPESAEALHAFEQRLRSSPLYENVVVSSDGRWTLLSLESDLYTSDDFDPLDPGAAGPLRRVSARDDGQMIDVVEQIIAKHAGPAFEVHVGGGLKIGNFISNAVRKDFSRLLVLALTVIVVLLFWLLRRLSSVLLVISVVMLSLFGTLGLMAAMGTPVGLGTQILPTFLLAVGVGYSVHLIAHFSQHYRVTNDRKIAVAASLEHCGRAILLTGLTTMAGLLSFVSTDLAFVSQIGVFAPIGVAFAVLYSLLLLPALLVLLPLRPAEAPTRAPAALRAVIGVGLWAADHRRTVAAGLCFVLVLSAAGTARLRSSVDPLMWLPEADALRTTTEIVDENLGGSSLLELLVESKPGHDLRDPEFLARIDRLEAEVAGLEVGPLHSDKVLGVHRVVKEIHQALHEGDAAAYVVPGDEKQVAQELLLFEMSGADDLERLVDPTFELGRVTARIPWSDAYDFVPYAQEVLARSRALLGDFAEVRLAGILAVTSETFVRVIRSLEISYGIAICVISLLLFAAIGDRRVALVSLIPNLAPILIALGFMGWLDIPLTTFTLLVGSIGLGLAVDDTIHFAHSFLRYEQSYEDPRDAIGRTLATTGAALLFTTVALVCGFLVFGLATLSGLVEFGVVAAVAIAAAFVGDIVVLPMLLAWLREEHPARGFEPELEPYPRRQARSPFGS